MVYTEMKHNNTQVQIHITKPAIGMDTFLRHITNHGWTTRISEDESVEAVRGDDKILNISRRYDRVSFEAATIPEGIEVWPKSHAEHSHLLNDSQQSYTPEVLRAGLFERGIELDAVRLPLEVERYIELDAARAMRGAELLENSWVILLYDPDFSGWSPWCVIAPSYEDAVREAMSDWWHFAGEPGPCTAASDDCGCRTCVRASYDPPEMLKAYRGSWIGNRVDNLKG